MIILCMLKSERSLNNVIIFAMHRMFPPFNLDMFSPTPTKFSDGLSACFLSAKEKRSGCQVIYIMFLNFWVVLPFYFQFNWNGAFGSLILWGVDNRW